MASEESWTFTISADSPEAQPQEVVNKYNLAPVQLQKKMFNGSEYVNVGRDDYAAFNDAFSLEKQVGEMGEKWETVPPSISLSQTGEYLTTLPVYDEAGKPILYRFRETLPQGWHDPNNPSAETMLSEEFTLEGHLGNPINEPYVVIMENDRNGSHPAGKELPAPGPKRQLRGGC